MVVPTKPQDIYGMVFLPISTAHPSPYLCMDAYKLLVSRSLCSFLWEKNPDLYYLNLSSPPTCTHTFTLGTIPHSISSLEIVYIAVSLEALTNLVSSHLISSPLHIWQAVLFEAWFSVGHFLFPQLLTSVNRIYYQASTSWIHSSRIKTNVTYWKVISQSSSILIGRTWIYELRRQEFKSLLQHLLAIWSSCIIESLNHRCLTYRSG